MRLKSDGTVSSEIAIIEIGKKEKLLEVEMEQVPGVLRVGLIG